MFTLEDTLLGYLADDLTWCGEFSTSGEALGPVGLPRDVEGEQSDFCWGP